MEETKIGKQGVLVVNNFFNEDYSWNNFINCINDGYDLQDPNNQVYPHKESIGKVNFWSKLTVTLDNINETNFAGIEEKIERLTQFHSTIANPGRHCGIFGAVSFTTKEPTTGKHNDPIDVIYAQFIGTVVWTIYGDNESESFTLNPGDIIYVPKSVMHEVTSLTPRAAISFMFEA
jgi:mannose-6-phosphate isomerase-like protein (cupin superfamily)